MLTDWCSAACACCYASCSPDGQRWLAVDGAVAVWADLIDASPHGCRIHLTGGEVFGRYEHLLAVCREARRRGLGPLESVETNGFWASDEALVRDRLLALDDAGMGRLTISADPYHQQFVPIDRARRLARVAEKVLGSQRIRVRWRDWLAEGSDTHTMSPPERADLFTRYAARGRDRFTGRAARGLDRAILLRAAADFDDNPCGERLLRGRHVHVAPGGQVWPATCVGIVVGNALAESASEIWRALSGRWAESPIVGPLSRRGPVGLLDLGRQTGFAPRRQGYADKCQLCYDLRRHLQQLPEMAERLGPAEVYAVSGPPNEYEPGR